MPSRILQLKQVLQKAGSSERAKTSAWFFKTGKGEYGEGDRFLGITVPVQRKIAYQFVELSLKDIEALLTSPIHEHRYVAVEILVARFERATTPSIQKEIFTFYLEHSQRINNWDLVDTSAPYIVGEYLLHRSRTVLYRLAKSKNLWQRRIAIVATQAFIRRDDFKETLAIVELLLTDTHDLIHKAAGWMLREIGKRNKQVLCRFLDVHCGQMPRTMLRYAIEHFPQDVRKAYLA